jgi:hypothetical protein
MEAEMNTLIQRTTCTFCNTKCDTKTRTSMRYISILFKKNCFPRLVGKKLSWRTRMEHWTEELNSEYGKSEINRFCGKSQWLPCVNIADNSRTNGSSCLVSHNAILRVSCPVTESGNSPLRQNMTPSQFHPLPSSQPIFILALFTML